MINSVRGLTARSAESDLPAGFRAYPPARTMGLYRERSNDASETDTQLSERMAISIGSRSRQSSVAEEGDEENREGRRGVYQGPAGRATCHLRLQLMHPHSEVRQRRQSFQSSCRSVFVYCVECGGYRTVITDEDHAVIGRSFPCFTSSPRITVLHRRSSRLPSPIPLWRVFD